MNPQGNIWKGYHRIRGWVFDLAQRRKINPADLDEFNESARLIHDGLAESKKALQKLTEEKKAGYVAWKAALEREEKLILILEMVGLTTYGREQLMELPVKFLESINRGLKHHHTILEHENHFRLVEQSHRWLLQMIERDRMNLESMPLQKKLYRSKHPEVREMARRIMIQMAGESVHITDELRAGKTFKESKQKIEQYWYDKLSTYNITGEKSAK